MLARIEREWITSGRLDVAFMNLRACVDASEVLDIKRKVLALNSTLTAQNW